MLIFLNGKFVPEDQGMISVFDRSFCYGDGLFEAIPVFRGKLFLWEKHFARLETGAKYLRLKLPYSATAIFDFARTLLSENKFCHGILRLQLSRGVGGRGYSIQGAASPSLVMTLHPARTVSDPAKIITSTVRIPVGDSLSRFKTCSKISHVLARAEADEQGVDEALLLNTDGCLAEATSSNIFWVEGQTVCTPPVESGALPGVTRDLILELCQRLQIASSERGHLPQSLAEIEGAFLTSSGFGVREISSWDGRVLPSSVVSRTLRAAYVTFTESADSF